MLFRKKTMKWKFFIIINTVILALQFIFPFTLVATAEGSKEPTYQYGKSNLTTVEENVANSNALQILTKSEMLLDKNKIPKQFSGSSHRNTIHNNFLEYYVNYDGRFTIGTTGGHPNSLTDDNQNLLYGHPYPGTSYTTINIDGDSFVFTANHQAPVTDENGLTNVSEGVFNGIHVKQVITLTQRQADPVEIKYIVTNMDTVSHRIGTRILFDTMVGGNDAAVFKVPGLNEVTKEQKLEGASIPPYWQAYDNFENPTVISQGTLYKDEREKPDKVIFASWSKSYSSPWNFEINANSQIGDSAVSMYWNPHALAPNETREYVTYYGIAGELNEPNDTFETATFVKDNSETLAKIGHTGDLDYYKFSVSPRSEVTINVSDPISIGGFNIELYNSSRKLINRSIPVKGKLQVKIPLAPGDYYIKVKSNRKSDYKLILTSRSLQEVVLILPGVMGTELWEGSDRIWKPEKWGSASDIQRLSLDKKGNSRYRVSAKEPMAEYYKNLREQITNKGSNVEVEYFGYDWRLDNEQNARSLSRKIEQLLKTYEVDQVSIVAHSMGGLIATHYISSVRGGAEKVNKLITLGTPYFGAPEAYFQMETGEIGKEDIPSNFRHYIFTHFRGVIPDLRSIYQLMPTKTYLGKSENGYISVAECLVCENFKPLKTYKDYQGFFYDYRYKENYNRLRKATSDPWFNPDAQKGATAFHDKYGSKLYSILKDKDTYLIVGKNETTTKEVKVRVLPGQEYYGFQMEDVEPGQGDGTVPFNSATLFEKAIKDKVFFAESGVTHAELPADSNVIEQVVAILNDKPEDGSLSHTSPAETQSLLKVRVKGPTELHMYDHQNRHMGVKNGIVEEQIPRGKYYDLGQTKIGFVHGEKSEVKLVGKGDGQITLSLTRYDPEYKKQELIEFKPVKANQKSIINLSVSENKASPVQIEIDQDGNGKTDQLVKPSKVTNFE